MKRISSVIIAVFVYLLFMGIMTIILFDNWLKRIPR